MCTTIHTNGFDDQNYNLEAVNIFKGGCLFQRPFLGLTLYYLHLVTCLMSFFTSGPQNRTPSSNRSKFLGSFQHFQPQHILAIPHEKLLITCKWFQVGGRGPRYIQNKHFCTQSICWAHSPAYSGTTFPNREKYLKRSQNLSLS